MIITKLELNHFRGAQSLSLDFHERLNVFVGVNGAGKSSVLDAAAILLSWMVNRIKHASASGRPISESDIQNGESTGMLNVTCQVQGSYFSWSLAKTRKGHVKRNALTSLIALSEVAKQFQAEISENDENVNLPLMAYYPVNRAVLDIPLRIREKHRFGLLAAYDEALSGGASFRQFFEWFREREDLENEIRRDRQVLFPKINAPFPDPQLEAVRQALEQLMPDFKNLTVRRNPLRMEVEKKGKRLSVNQLSDGEKCLMAMVGDLARRMAIANPVRNNPLEGEGIVLIDEIDLHLHPKWQRMIIPKLIDIFPKCQFIVSTHSPHVLTHVEPKSIYVLKETELGIIAAHPAESYGKNVDRILEDLMGLETTRPDPINNELKHLYKEIGEGRLSEARKIIKEMKNKIGEDPELVKAGVLIKRREMIGK